MSKTAPGGFYPPKGKPSGNSREQQGEQDLTGGDIEREEKIADRLPMSIVLRACSPKLEQNGFHQLKGES